MKCPICEVEIEKQLGPISGGSTTLYPCPRCLPFGLSFSAEATLPETLRGGLHTGALLSYLVRRLRRDGGPPTLTTDLIRQLLAEHEPPTPAEQVNNLILWLGQYLTAPGEQILLTSQEHRSVAGSLTDSNFHWLLSFMVSRGYFDGTVMGAGGASGTLSFDAWALFEEIRAGSTDTRLAFMAMPFGNAVLDSVFIDCFKPAAKAAGFELIRLDERPAAGSIDDRLRVEIRRTRFLVADLTDGNHGAYWEAGFAEGLGKPVIYTCEKSYFDDPGTHFDTNHHHTVLWGPEALKSAAQDLTNTIRATLPEDAQLADASDDGPQ